MSEEIVKNFEYAVQQVKTNDNKSNTRSLPDEVKLKFYALYKQATVGKCNISKPWMIQVTECAKWEAWDSLGSMSKEIAMKRYYKLYIETMDKYT